VVFSVLNYKYHDKLDNNPDIQVRRMRLNDLPEIARLYEEVFSDHFLGHMDQKFLKLFCSQFINSATNCGYVAKCNGKSVGFLLGTIDNAPFNQFYRQNFIPLAWIVVKKYLTDAYVRKHITKRLGNILVAIQTLLPSFKRESTTNQCNTLVPARLLAIGVETNYRGIGIANSLTGQFCAEMKSEGLKAVGLSVLIWNKRAINFYKKDGWIQEASCETSLSFTRKIRPNILV